MRTILIIIFLTLIFDLIPFLVTPSMAIPIAEYLSFPALIIAVFFLGYSIKNDARTYRLIGYSFICTSIWLSSLSWLGIPFIDFVFMITAAIGFILNMFLVVILIRNNKYLSKCFNNRKKAETV
jgi:hypothetical protein